MNTKTITTIPSLLKKFISVSQQQVLRESDESVDIISDIVKQIESTPKTYETDGQGDKAMAMLHYFKDSHDWYITERDSEDDQYQAFGLAVLGQDWQNAELGYINIEELKQIGVELDLYWTPKSLGEIRNTESNIKTVPKMKEDTVVIENVTEPSAKEVSLEPMINTHKIELDNSNPLEEKNIQNADLTTEPYIPTSQVCDTVETSIPVSMMYEMNKSLSDLNRKVRGVDDYVRQKLGYTDLIDLCTAFSAEQVDAIAMAIYQIDQGKALIVGDQTGIGKGRVGAAIMLYAKRMGKKPIVFTEKPNLFSDIYRDISAIGMDDSVAIEFNTGEQIERVKKVTRKEIIEAIENDIDNNDFELDYNSNTLFKKGNESKLESAIQEYRDLYFPNEVVLEDRYVKNPNYETDIRRKKRFVPFIINNRDKRTDIKDINGNLIYRALEDKAKGEILDSKILPDEYDCIMVTYSQVSNPKQSKRKTDFLLALAQDNIIIMDESQNASGASNTGRYLIELLDRTLGVTYLSATFAKRPDNMPVYAMKTSMRDTGLTSIELISAISQGGVPLQEIVSSLMVAEGQMVRRERSYEGIDVNYVYLNDSQSEIGMPQFDLSEEQRAIADKITDLVRRTIAFQEKYVRETLDAINKKIKEEQKKASQNEQQKDATINNTPVFSGIFQLITQLLFSLKADAVADYAIMRMKQGKKPIIAFSSTLESFLDYLSQSDDETIPTDFSIILKRRLQKVMEYRISHSNGMEESFILEPDELGFAGQQEFESIMDDIENTSAGISVSPIDRIINRVKEAGFEIGEVTGRNRYVEFTEGGKGYIKRRSKPNATDVFRKFNNNQFDCLLINQSGAVGASAHAIRTDRVYEVKYDAQGNAIIPTSLDDKTEVKQRVMIILQAELDINKEVQKRGRPNRTGQVFKPIYDYIISDVPAEMRLMMMLQKKLKSLDANTSSNQKQSKKVLDVVDFLNEYGDEKVVEFLEANPEFNRLTGNIVKFEFGKRTESTNMMSDIAHRVSGRIAILPVSMQEEFYNTITRNYAAYERQLKDEGKWTLEVEKLDLRATTTDKSCVSVGSEGRKSVFGGAVFIERCEVNNLRRPYSHKEMVTILNDSLKLPICTGETTTYISASPVEITASLNERLTSYASNLKSNATSSWEVVKNRQIAEIVESKAYNKLKTEDDRIKYRSVLTEKIKEDHKEGVLTSLMRIDDLEADVRKSINFFKAKKLVAYPFENTYVTGICTGLRFYGDVTSFTRSHIDAEILIPNSIRKVLIPLSSQMVDTIMDLTSQHLSHQNEVTAKRFVEEWDFETQNNRAERVIRYIVTGNILKAFGMNEYSSKGKLISYTTSDNQIKKGILLGNDFKIEGLRVTVPLKSAEKLILGLVTGQVFYISDSLRVAKTNHFWRVYVSKFSYTDLQNNKEITLYGVNPKWEKQRGESDYYNDFELAGIKKLLAFLTEKFSMNASIPANVFDTMKDQFDIEDRIEKQLGEDALIMKYNAELDAYTKEKEFVHLDESQINKLDDLEKQLYEAHKEIATLRQQKHWFRMFSSLSKEKKKKDIEKTKKIVLEDGGSLDKKSDSPFADYNWESLFEPLSDEEVGLRQLAPTAGGERDEKNALAKSLNYGNPSTVGQWHIVSRDIIRTIKNEWRDMVDYYNRGNKEAAIDTFQIAKEQIQMLKNMGWGAKKYADHLEKRINETLDELIFKKSVKLDDDSLKVRDLEGVENVTLVSNSQEIKTIISDYAPSLLEIDEVSKEPYSSAIGGVFIKHTPDGDAEKIYVFEGDVADLSKFVWEIYPSNTYINQ